jgi:ubiquinone/menaquinone biosynthesis C-methylase UbiE
MRDNYTHGHHESVLRSHSWRTAQNSAAYLLDLLEPGQTLLDVGCGPGTITLDLADRVSPGRVIGLDREPSVIGQADAERRRRGTTNVSFSTGDVYHMEFADASFDLVHAHQLLQHLTRPIAALKEIYRVLRPHGMVAVREGDYGTFTWAPADPWLDRWLEIYRQVTRHNQAESNAGRYLLGWVQAAGFTDARVTSSTLTFADPDGRDWWGSMWADRVRLSAYADQAIEHGLADRAELDAIADAWRRWAAQPDGIFVTLAVEVVARRPGKRPLDMQA